MDTYILKTEDNSYFLDDYTKRPIVDFLTAYQVASICMKINKIEHAKLYKNEVFRGYLGYEFNQDNM